MKTKALIFLFVLLISFSCKSTKVADKATTTTTIDTYRLIVTFISRGAGTDSQTLAALESLITTFSNRDGFKVTYEKFPWGKEGESDYCFKMEGMKKGKQNEFVKSVKNLVKDSTLVIISENAVCNHKK
jgi:hypothetical protein